MSDDVSVLPSKLPCLCASPPAQDSFLDEGFILDKKIGVGQPKRIENAKILVANTGAPALCFQRFLSFLGNTL